MFYGGHTANITFNADDNRVSRWIREGDMASDNDTEWFRGGSDDLGDLFRDTSCEYIKAMVAYDGRERHYRHRDRTPAMAIFE